MARQRYNITPQCKKAIAFVIAAVGLLAISSIHNPTSALEKLRVGTSNSSGLSLGMANLVLAMDGGFFKSEGLDVEIISFKGSAVLYPQLATKQIMIGYPTPDGLITSYASGRDHLPVAFFYNLFRRNVWEFAVPEKSPIRTLKDLRGKRLGVGLLTSGYIPTTKAALADVGLEVGKDVELVPVGYGATAFQAIKEGRVDALNLFDVLLERLKNSGFPIRLLPSRKYADFFGNGFATHEDNIKDKADTLARFGRAVAKATVACYANLKHCREVYYAHFPSKRPAKGGPKVNEENDIRILEARGRSFLYFPPGSPHKFGEFSKDSWESYIEALRSQKVIGEQHIPADRLFTNKFVGAFNDFDAEAVRSRAKELK